jgi:N-acetylglucosaminyldiphosphoundecaprenol N-acetyl-beta-D-mannosaminyltransferase
VNRAPPWISSLGVEWVYRLAQEPRRLWRRYLLRDPKFAGIFLREVLANVRETARH